MEIIENESQIGNSLLVRTEVAEGAAAKDGEDRSKNALHF